MQKSYPLHNKSKIVLFILKNHYPSSSFVKIIRFLSKIVSLIFKNGFYTDILALQDNIKNKRTNTIYAILSF